MKLRTDHKLCLTAVMTAVLGFSVPCNAQEQVYNVGECTEIESGTGAINREVGSQTKDMAKSSVLQGSIAGEFMKMKQWEQKYNSYLKTTTGYAEAIKAGSMLVADGVDILRNIYVIKKAIAKNPQGVVATISMNDIYMETVAELIKTYSVLNECVAKGGEGNMLTAAERTQLVWNLTDEMERLSKKLRKMAISIVYYNMMDVWDKATVGMTSKGHEKFAREAMKRWQRSCDPDVQEIVNGN